MRAAHLALTAALLVFGACWYAAPPCGVFGATYDGTDCEGWRATVTATAEAFGHCDAGSSDVARERMAGWAFHVRPESATLVRPDGQGRYWLKEHPNGEAPDGGDLGWVYAETDFAHRTVDFADENWANGVLVSETIHVQGDECCGFNPYPAWATNGRACVHREATP